MRRSLVLLITAVLLCLTAGSELEKVLRDRYTKFKEVPNLSKDEAGNRVLDVEGVRWVAFKDDQSGQIYFVNTETEEAQWHDPRVPGRPRLWRRTGRSTPARQRV